MKSQAAESAAAVGQPAIDGALPAGWRIDNFEQLAVLQRGFDLPSSARTAGDVPIIGSNGIVGWHSEARVRGPGVVTGRSGSIGDSTYVEGEYWPLNTSLYISNFHDNIPRFVHYFIQWFDLSRFASGVSVPTLNRNSVFGTAVKIPTPREQEKIAAVLWKLQRSIATQDRLIAATRDLKHSMMARLFSHGVHSASIRETQFGDVPSTWDEQPLGICCHVQTGVTKGRKIAADEAIEVPYLRVANVQDGHLDLREIKTITIRRRELDGYLLQDGDVLLTEGGDFDKLGRGYIWRRQIANCVHQNHVFAVRANRALLMPEFLAFLVQSPYGKAYFLTVAHRTTNLASINSTKLKALPVLLPSLDEQREIIATLTTVDRKLAHHQKKRAALNDLFQTLLHKLMTGEIRVADIDIDTSEITALPGAPA